MLEIEFIRGTSLVREADRRSDLPIVGNGAGIWSFTHIADAAAATLAALQRGATGIYNVADDEPAPVREWLPFLANAIGAAVVGVVLAHLYVALAPLVSGTLASGPPGYDLEVWLANALLSVTFPFLIYYAVFFGYWPLTKSAASPVVAKT